ncbi:MAG: ABC transporter permease [Acidobacteriota bacterium]
MRLLYLIKKEFIEILRQRELVFVMIVAPVIQVILLGYLVTTDIKNIPVNIVNLSSDKATVRIMNRIINSPLFDVKNIFIHNIDSLEVLKRGDVKAIILFRDNFDKKKSFKNYPETQILLDGVDSNSSQIAAGYVNGIIRNFIIDDINRYGLSPLIRGKPLIRFNPRLRSINYMGPGIVALLLSIIALFITSLSLVREKEQQTIDTLLMSRLKPIEIYIGKAVPMGIVGLIDMVIGVFVVVLWFDIPVRGSFFYLFLSSLIYLTAILSYGLLISVFSSSQQQSLFFSWFSLVTFILLSGLFTPVENIPKGMRWLVDINPLRYLIKIIREIFLKGNGIEYFYRDLLALLAITLVISSISIFNFKRFISK